MSIIQHVLMVGVAVVSLVLYTSSVSAQTTSERPEWKLPVPGHIVSETVIPSPIISVHNALREYFNIAEDGELHGVIGFKWYGYKYEKYLLRRTGTETANIELCASVPDRYPRLGPDNNPVPLEYTSVTYKTSDGTAKAGVNYTAASGTVQVPSEYRKDEGCFTLTLKVEPDDLRPFTEKYFFVNLSGEHVNERMGQAVVSVVSSTSESYMTQLLGELEDDELQVLVDPDIAVILQTRHAAPLPAGQKIIDASINDLGDNILRTLTFRVQKRGAGINSAGQGTRTVRLFPSGGSDLNCTIASAEAFLYPDVSFTVQPSTGAADDRYLTVNVSTSCETVDIELWDDVNGKVWRKTVTESLGKE